MLALRTLTAKFRAREYSTTEAAVITGVPLTTVNHYISRELKDLGIAVWGDGKRSISYDGLVALRMGWDYSNSMAPSSRVDVIQKALRSPRKKHLTLEGGKLIVRVDTARSAVSKGLRRFYEAEAMITSDANILTGAPCFRGTRIPVYTVASIAAASGIEAAKRTYSRLTRSQIDSALLYAKAHPRRGRPKRAGEVLARRKPKSSRTVSVTVD